MLNFNLVSLSLPRGFVETREEYARISEALLVELLLQRLDPLQTQYFRQRTLLIDVCIHTNLSGIVNKAENQTLPQQAPKRFQ